MAKLKLPIILDRLSPEARNWVIIKSAETGQDPEKLARQIIEEAASNDGFKPQPPISQSQAA